MRNNAGTYITHKANPKKMVVHGLCKDLIDALKTLSAWISNYDKDGVMVQSLISDSELTNWRPNLASLIGNI